ncbi:glycosyltransferase family 4 protein [Candidatus Gracilibacteria bacterium]|nr:glycosyltransferase family 4 protein [Candidatus Gracilibacteria bacterium]MCF7898626.1 glycosyltransferase family 4 protein [Candidatus Paceibacterota bacterium]
MKISQLLSTLHPTYPKSQHAINSHVSWLSDGLVGRGHNVHLFASNESETNAELHSTTPALSTLSLSDSFIRHYLMTHITNCYEFSQKNVDVVHSHFNLLSSFVGRIASIPTVTSIHSPLSDEIKPLLEKFRNERYISFSLAQRKQLPSLNWYANIYHGVDTTLFAYNEKPEDYFLYIGRITEDKGVHLAIEAAKAAGVKLRIAGASYPAEGYWHKHIEPHINGDTVRFFGSATFDDKISLIQNAKALLFPTQVQEIFGYVMIEAMSCGTPVIGWNNGSVDEIVQHDVTGYVVDTVEGMTDAIKKIDQIDRLKVRQRAERYFSVEKMVSGYEKVYKRVLDDESFKNHKKSLKTGNTVFPSVF